MLDPASDQAPTLPDAHTPGTSSSIAQPVIRRAAGSEDLDWVAQAHGELYSAEFGFNSEMEALVTRILSDYRNGLASATEAMWLAELNGRRVGSIGCMRVSQDIARLRVLLIDPLVRGQRLGRRLVDTCVAFARDVGYRQIVLTTSEQQGAAIRIYLQAGFRLTGAIPTRRFSVDLVEQEYVLDL